MFQPMKEWVNKVNLSSFELENFFKFGACVISARKAKQLNATTMFTYSHANTPLGQSECTYYLSYFIKNFVECPLPPLKGGGGVVGQKKNDIIHSQTQITLYEIGLKLVTAVMVI